MTFDSGFRHSSTGEPVHGAPAGATLVTRHRPNAGKGLTLPSPSVAACQQLTLLRVLSRWTSLTAPSQGSMAVRGEQG